MKLRKFLKKYYPNLNVRYNHSIENITDYDKDVMTNGIFVSLSDLTYIENAVNLGAKTIVLNSKYKKSKFTKSKKVNYLFVDSPIVFLARIIREVISNLDKNIETLVFNTSLFFTVFLFINIISSTNFMNKKNKYTNLYLFFYIS